MHRRWRVLIPFLAVGVSIAPLSTLAPSVRAASAPDGTACPTYTEVAMVGSACRLSSGLWQVRIPGGGVMTTHGLDEPEGHATFPPSWPAVDPPCVDDPDTEYHGQVIYARPSDRPDRYATLRPEIEDMAAYANGLLSSEAAEFDRDVQYRMACTPAGVVQVDAVNLSKPYWQLDYATVVGEVQAAGYTSPTAKYWIWVDFPYNGGGVGGFVDDNRLAPSNGNNRGPGYGITWGTRLTAGGSNVMMHENGHNLGAVAGTAPHSSGAAHCNDGKDIMCYADGGPKSNYNPNVCAAWHFDCGHDDYFHPNPVATSYVGRSWNLASPVNRFVEGCAYRSGSLALGLSGLGIDGADSITVPLDASCADHLFSLSGAIQAGTVTWEIADFDVCWYAGTVKLRCDTIGSSFTSGRVPIGATGAEVTLRTGANANYVFSVI